MEKLERIKELIYTYKKQIVFGLSALVLTIFTCLSFILINKRYNIENNEEKSIITTVEEKNNNSVTTETEEDKIKVDIKGLVLNPGVYELSDGSRIIDAINISGGLQENADTRYINLSKTLEDEMVIIIYSKEEIERQESENQSEITNNLEIKLDVKDTSNVVTNSQVIEQNKSNTSTEIKTSENSSLNTIVNINEASLEMLMTLSGIGESKANKIIEYRNANGKFKSIEEIQNVKGIGTSIYEKIKDNITV